jgi:hypothetical protein
MSVLTKFREKLSVAAEAIGRLYGRPHIVQDFWSDREMVLIDSNARPLGLGVDIEDFGIWCGLFYRQSTFNIADSNKDIPNTWSVEKGGSPSKFPGSSNLTVGPYQTVAMLGNVYVDYDINKIIVSPLWPFIALVDDGVIVPKLEVTDGKEEDSYFVNPDGVEFKHDVPEGFVVRDDYDILMSLAVYDEMMNETYPLGDKEW